jgi:ADP-ribosyl-[dinitrogen reductase] hydrolase
MPVTDFSLTDRYRGALLGLAVGDAVGTTVEFKSPGSFEPVTDMTGGGPFELEPGQWTDDTSMALCLADSLLEKRGFDARDQMERYVRWWQTGYRSSNGRCFDIGITISDALKRFERSGNPWSGSTDPYSAGNGSVMRLAPVVLAYAGSTPSLVVQMSLDSSLTTHGAEEAVDACRYFGALISLALSGQPKEAILSSESALTNAGLRIVDLAPNLGEVANGSFRSKEPPDIQGSGYVVRSVEAALWAFDRTDDFESGCLAAVNLGDDADTTAAIYGQIAGAYYGASGIPKRWLKKLHASVEITEIADGLQELSRELELAHS